ncbi:MAG: pseudouridine-5'-phosphate glycosidase [Phycisphaerales bacterium]
MPKVALETTLLLHGVPRDQARVLADDLAAIVRSAGAEPSLVGILRGRPLAALTDADLDTLLASPEVMKVNTAGLGAVMARGRHGATTVSTTLEIAAAAGIRVFATGGLGGLHKGLATHLDISADLGALARFPVAVVTSGCKSILDVAGTRELLETLGIPVIGFRTDRFPAFYLRDGGIGVDARFDDVPELARFVRHELARTNRGMVIANPIPEDDELAPADWATWMADAAQRAHDRGVQGRDITPALLAALHEISGGRTLQANLALVRSNARLAGQLAAAME